MEELSAKVVLLGSGAVGKTSLIRQFVEQRFEDDYISTIGVNVKKKLLEDLGLKMIIWDIYGQKLSESLHSSNYSGAKGALVVCDLTRRETFNDLEMWIEDIFNTIGRVPVVILGNKIDLIDDYETGDLKTDFHSFMLKDHSDVVDYYKNVYGITPSFERIPNDILTDWLNSKRREVTDEMPFYKTSAKTGENVEEAFVQLGEMILDSDMV